MTNQDRSAISPDALERLETYCESALKPTGSALADAYGHTLTYNQIVAKFVADLRALLSERKALRDALEPFSKAGEHFKSYGHNAARGGAPADEVYFGWPDLKVLIGDFYRAASILGEPKP